MIKWIKNVFRNIKFSLVPKRKRVYRIVRCPKMPSVLDFKVYGTPIENQPFISVHNSKEGYRSFYCAKWSLDVGQLYRCHTKYMQIFLKRIK
jgi:hypothetical protein